MSDNNVNGLGQQRPPQQGGGGGGPVPQPLPHLQLPPGGIHPQPQLQPQQQPTPQLTTLLVNELTALSTMMPASPEKAALLNFIEQLKSGQAQQAAMNGNPPQVSAATAVAIAAGALAVGGLGGWFTKAYMMNAHRRAHEAKEAAEEKRLAAEEEKAK